MNKRMARRLREGGKKVYLDTATRCSCGHQAGHHKLWEPPAPCRMKDCLCEGFYKVNRDGSFMTIPEGG